MEPVSVLTFFFPFRDKKNLITQIFQQIRQQFVPHVRLIFIQLVRQDKVGHDIVQSERSVMFRRPKDDWNISLFQFFQNFVRMLWHEVRNGQPGRLNAWHFRVKSQPSDRFLLVTPNCEGINQSLQRCGLKERKIE